MSFGTYFRELRISRNITQEQVAEEIGKTKMLISNVETDKNNPFCYCDLKKISKLFNLSRNEYNLLLKEAGRTRRTLPPDILKYVYKHDEIYKLLEILTESNMKNSLLKKIAKYAEEIKNV